MYYVYVLKSTKTSKWYTGATRDLQKRFQQHNSSSTKATKDGKPWQLIYYEACHNKFDMRAREKYLKSGMGKRYIKNRLKCFFAEGF